MILQWLTRRRRNRLRQMPFPHEWQQVIHQNVAGWQRMTSAEQSKIRGDVLVLAREKNWEGCQGLEMTDEIKVTISTHIGILCLGFVDEYFDKVKSVLVYPDAYVARQHTMTQAGIVLEGNSHRLGEAWYRGPVILSWQDVLEDGLRDADGHNLVFHEFAHQLDMQNGRVADGVPPMERQSDYQRWQLVFDREFQTHVQRCQSGQHVLIDCYGATSRAEFFATATECFFERPANLLRQHRELYDILADYYHQNPVDRYR
jgi:Mlc titration factor MtfA (ptsG expression regulator)